MQPKYTPASLICAANFIATLSAQYFISQLEDASLAGIFLNHYFPPISDFGFWIGSALTFFGQQMNAEQIWFYPNASS